MGLLPNREKAEIGLFVTLDEPSAPMCLEAATAGVYRSDRSGRDYQRIQILTIAELLEEHLVEDDWSRSAEPNSRPKLKRNGGPLSTSGWAHRPDAQTFLRQQRRQFT